MSVMDLYVPFVPIWAEYQICDRMPVMGSMDRIHALISKLVMTALPLHKPSTAPAIMAQKVE